MIKQKQPWFVGAALCALGANVKTTTREFTPTDLAAWAPDFGKAPGNAELAMERLVRHEMVVAASVLPDSKHGSLVRLKRYKLTPRGLATCRAAAAAQGSTQPDPAALSTRLWNLLRIRRKLTSDEAASVLVDAGSDEEMASTKRTLATYLATWAKLAPDAVQPSVRRVNGCKAYVLVKDPGMHPPKTKVSSIPHAAAPAAHAPPANTRRKVVAE